jgi:hypothetical protein
LDAAPPPNVPKKRRIRWGRWILGGLAGYVVYLIFPKPREFTDPLHYYSNWMVNLLGLFKSGGPNDVKKIENFFRK